MARIYDCSLDKDLLTGTRLARTAIGRGELVVLPTDTVYGVAANAFDAAAVRRLLEAKGRTRQSPPPVLIGDHSALNALAENVPDAVRDLAKAFWPGGLTIVLHAQPSLVWDLGETRGTVALRMPDNPVTLELLAETGPLAVSSANKTGQPSATTVQEAFEQLGDSVEVYLDVGQTGSRYRERPAESSESSTIVDATALSFVGGTLRILRQGVVSAERLREVMGELLPDTGVVSAAETAAEPQAQSASESSPQQMEEDQPVGTARPDWASDARLDEGFTSDTSRATSGPGE
ncbi:L-threonylcarbamoyladenylate synthase [Rathayibacter toxicus]|uniref:L-threonylcarbamoyladenylate synthase n=1 Tax=Rathayibacter toxicus TaxID=145458 RepID=A0A2S5Y661_9MICO|nr:L-threonylcarbamoyladenylate synthase [Rathayibacter toxicus]PPG20412.1 threonylcarbamoyl-AMP synthase [Rathayibacter toxicus]PPG45514.1 threonylcarbamoyl-AMP synthase [Rathayibacter toxicus]PPH22614.1 threonylcarbamoyl-AMP synthase [Rathayibacter toxicus]PPH56816.1 threonylcarbamoyl-AMP synthase [Rathayibacter toxicus]PPH59508.1 threonylcarbamoyl-AMP synthase [Rathayibacter toxicus]